MEFYFSGALNLSLNFCYAEDLSLVKMCVNLVKYTQKDGHDKTQKRLFVVC